MRAGAGGGEREREGLNLISLVGDAVCDILKVPKETHEALAVLQVRVHGRTRALEQEMGVSCQGSAAGEFPASSE